MADRRVGPPGLAPRGGAQPPATMATQMRHQAPMASYAPRPVGPWRALRTPDGKHVYYHNAATNETTWTRPPDYVDPGPPRGGATFHTAVSAGVAPDAASASASAASSVTQIHVPGTTWYEVTQPGKPSYFHDAATRAVVWTPPPAVLEARRRQTQTRTMNVPRDAPRRDVPRQTRNENATVSASRAADGELNASKPKEEYRARSASPSSPPKAPLAPTEEPPLDDDDDVEFDPDAYEETDTLDTREDTHEDVVEVGGYFVPRSALAPEEPQKPAAESASDTIAREFRELLSEKGVDATSRWDRKARELSGDSRFKAVRSHAERRRLFERHARDAGDAAKKIDAAKKNDFKADADAGVAAARLMERRRKEDRARRERELAHANVSRLRAKNARDVAVERFKTLLAESEKKWNLAESAPPGFDDAKQILFADAQRRAAVVAGAFEEDDMRALFEAHVSSAIHARVVDVAALLDEKLVARSAKDFLEEEEDEDDDDEEKEKTNPLVSFVAAQNFAPLASDPRWDRCPVEQRAAAYVRRVETLCAELNATVPEDVAELRDALAEARAKRLEKRGDGAEDGECDATG